MKINDVYHFFFPSSNVSTVDRIKAKHHEQFKQLETWAKKGEWDKIHSAHYDWWMFPVDRRSSAHGDLYTVSQKDIAMLKQDYVFMSEYRQGIAIVVKAWGWNLEEEKPIDHPQAGQQWTGYGVRLAKMSDSLHLFDEKALHTKLRSFFTHYCLPLQKTIPISDLEWLRKTFS